MRKKFKRKKNYFKYIVLILFIILIYIVLSSLLLKIKLTSSNEEFLKELLKDSNHHLAYENKNSLSSYFLKFLYQIDLKKPTSILNGFFGFNDTNNLYVVTSADLESEPFNSNYILDPTSNKVSKPLVYIYNTHQTENYSYKSYEEYNITPNVMMASYILRERLNKIGIETMVETANIKDILNANSWSYGYSYNASRYLVKDAISKYPSIKLFIDLHRDSVSHKASTVSINGKKYAKVMFVIGKEYKSYKNNLSVANKLNDIIKSKASISRGILLKEGKNVNGVYNQDLNSNVILIECGGNENSLDEVINTIDILVTSIKDYIGEING